MCRQGVATLTVQVGLVQLIVGTLEEKGTLLLGSVVYCLYNVAFARLLRPITNIAIMGALSSHHIHLRKLSRVSSLFSLRSGSRSLLSTLYSLDYSLLSSLWVSLLLPSLSLLICTVVS